MHEILKGIAEGLGGRFGSSRVRRLHEAHHDVAKEMDKKQYDELVGIMGGVEIRDKNGAVVNGNG